MRESIPADQRLSLTLRHLATGETQEELRLAFRVGQSTISGIVKEVCRAIYVCLQEEFLKCPSSEEEWKTVAQDFGEMWNFHNCFGAMDGKHCRIDPPLKSGSLYYNYKEQFSVVLLALVDAHLRFTYIDVGTNGRISDSGVWNKSSLKVAVETNTIGIPEPAALPGINEKFPFVIVGDEGFRLTKHVMIPFSKELLRGRRDRRIFNYRLSRSRRCSENSFGVLGARFQIFRVPMRYDPDDATDVIKACCVLHNMLRSQSMRRAVYTPPSFIDIEDERSGEVYRGEWRQEPAIGLANFVNQRGNRHARDPLRLREAWCDYFNGPGAVPWQERMT